MKFSASWRDYQARVLGEMQDHLDDGRLHVVAAPGSGKTVLGLEAMRRVGRKAVVLAPTITIRNQWRERLCPLFLPDLGPWRASVSDDLDAPSDITIATYQALHAAWKGREEPFAALRQLGPITLLLDECHHLRREWWNALFDLRKRLDKVTILALTATPPYDAGPIEWQRYEDLCGPIDSEIGVPELVRNGDLAPHQDHIHFSSPSQELVDALLRRRQAVFDLMEELAQDDEALAQFAAHPFICDPEGHEKEIFELPEAMSSILVLLAHAGRELPDAPIKLLGIDGETVPEWAPFWLQNLLQLVLHTRIGSWRLDEERHRRWRARLSEAGLISNGKVQFTETVELARQLAGSGAKLESVVDILKTESTSLGEDLRMAVLTDHVRAAELPRSSDDSYEPQRLGVVPIFETLRKSGIDQSLGVLSGTLVIIPAKAARAAHAEALALGIGKEAISLVPLGHDPAFLRLELKGRHSNARVALVTRMVAQGHVRVLVGTQALLGEGWDAPSINSLILASNAGSFMLSNQMRGRAIRTNPAEPGKVANIWHLATVDPHAIGDEGPDMRLMQRRFAMFDGVAESGDCLIENGMERLDIDASTPIEARNTLTLARAADRNATRDHWESSLGSATERMAIREVAETIGTPITSTIHVHHTLQRFAVSALGGGAVSAGLATGSTKAVGLALLAIGGSTLIYALPGLFNAGLLFLRNGTLERRLEQVGMVVLEGLIYAGQVSRRVDAYDVRVVRGLKGSHAITLEGGTRADQHRFVEAMLELLGPVENPRYLIRRYGHTFGFAQVDYHAVPAAIGTKREHAEFFLARWKLRIGQASMDYTRSKHGRRMLLKGRSSSLAAGMRNTMARRSMWL
jgi:hypothetical protein